MVFLIIIAAIVVIIIQLTIALEFQRIVKEKGYEQRKYFWMSFLLGMIGYMMVIALPDRSSTVNHESNPTLEKSESKCIDSPDEVIVECPDEIIIKCPHCEEKLFFHKDVSHAECPYCGGPISIQQ